MSALPREDVRRVRRAAAFRCRTSAQLFPMPLPAPRQPSKRECAEAARPSYLVRDGAAALDCGALLVFADGCGRALRASKSMASVIRYKRQKPIVDRAQTVAVRISANLAFPRHRRPGAAVGSSNSCFLDVSYPRLPRDRDQLVGVALHVALA